MPRKKVVSVFQEGPYRFQQEMVSCGKELCNKCREGIYHGPYWYVYFKKRGVEICKYIGKELKVPKKRERDSIMRETIDRLKGSVVNRDIERIHLDMLSKKYGYPKKK